MNRRPWTPIALTAGMLLLACAGESPLGAGDGGGSGGGGGGGGGGGPTLQPATYSASVNPTPPAGYTIPTEAPYRWQAYLYDNGAWVAVGRAQVTSDPSALMVIDCNDPVMGDACTAHRSAMIQVTIDATSPSPALLCSYKSGFQFRDDFFLNTPLGRMSVAPVATSSQDPGNQGVCFP
jgi:hypothetical protein